MPEFHSDSLVPPKHVVLSPFAMVVWCAILLIVLGFGVVFVSKFDFNRLLGVEHFAKKARLATAAKDWPAALEALRQIKGSDREKVTYLRVLADFLEATHTEPSLLDTTLDKLERKGGLQPQDFLWMARQRLAAGNLTAARKALGGMSVPLRQSLDYMKINAELFRQEGRLQEALDAESLLFDTYPDDPETAVRKAMRDLDGAFSELQEAALKRLWEIASQPGQPGAMAIRALSQRKGLGLAEAGQLRVLAGKNPGVPLQDRLQLTSLLMQLDPSRHDQLLEEEMKSYENADMGVKAQMASWLAREKQYDRILEVVPMKVVMSSPDLFPQVAQSLAEKGRWKELMELVKKGKKLPVSDARAATWRALAIRNLHPEDFKEVRLQLEEAIHEGIAEKNGLALLGAARLAEEWSMADLALTTYEALAVPGSAAEADILEKCWKTALILKNTEKLLKLADRRARLRPGNVQLAQLRDYMHLLCGDQLETSSAAVDATAGVKDVSDAALFIQALRAYRMHDLPLLSRTLGQIHDVSSLGAGERAVYAGLQAFNGQAAKAFQVAETVRPELLLNEESVFLKMAF